MAVFLVVFAVLSAIILAFHLAVAAGLLANMRREKTLPARCPAGLSPEVIVALRDEEKTLPLLLASLRAQTRKDCRFLFVDDRSTDGTPRLLEEFCAETGPRARVIHNHLEPDGLTGKQAALDLAFAQARGEVLLFTDGDCVMPEGWVEEMMRHFHRPEVGVVLGRIEIAAAPGFLGGFQAFEQPLLNQYNLGSTGMGVPTGCFGNNIAVRAAAVAALGGFHRLGYSVTEDAMLLDAVCRGGGWKAAACVSAGGAAVTVPKTRWRDFVDQHTRWNSGGLYSADPVTRLSFIFVVVIYLIGSLLVLPLGALDARVPLLSLNSFLSIGLLGVIGGFYQGKKRGRYFLRFLPFLFFFGFFYSFITLRAIVRRPFAWKGAALAPVVSASRTPFPRRRGTPRG
jgi:cellulose synthase/poly-beta-1,6-N-acetylglucosamine synthase-like glycosyltransferase